MEQIKNLRNMNRFYFEILISQMNTCFHFQNKVKAFLSDVKHVFNEMKL
jgi:hypothetical protein